MGESNDQIDRFCHLRLSHHNVSTRNASCSGSSAGQYDHANRRRMRTGQDTSWRCLRGQNHRSPDSSRDSQVCAMEWRKLPSLLLRRVRIGPGRNIAALKLLMFTSPANFCIENLPTQPTAPPAIAGGQQHIALHGYLKQHCPRSGRNCLMAATPSYSAGLQFD